jgi:hypothetical protein
MDIKELALWTLVAASSVGAGIYGYHRFKLIRPDLFDDGKSHGISEAERAARITEYQQKGDALSRAVSATRAPRVGEACVDGFIIEAIAAEGDKAKGKRVIESGQAIRCDALH